MDTFSDTGVSRRAGSRGDSALPGCGPLICGRWGGGLGREGTPAPAGASACTPPASTGAEYISLNPSGVLGTANTPVTVVIEGEGGASYTFGLFRASARRIPARIASSCDIERGRSVSFSGSAGWGRAEGHEGCAETEVEVGRVEEVLLVDRRRKMSGGIVVVFKRVGRGTGVGLWVR